MDIETIREYNRSYKNIYSPAVRLEKYIKGEAVDCLPYALNGAENAIMNMLGLTTSQAGSNPEYQKEIKRIKQEELGIFQEVLPIGIASFAGSTQGVPENGFVYIKDYALKDYSQFSDLPSVEGKFAFIDGLEKRAESILNDFPKTELKIFIGGTWSSASKVRSINDLLRDTRKNKQELIDLLDYATDFTLNGLQQLCDRVGKLPVFMADPISSNDLLS